MWKPRINPWLIAATVALAAFMEVLDTSIANVALPHIAGSLGASTDQGTWVLTSYLVSNAIVLPLGAWASSVMGRKNFFVFCIVDLHHRQLPLRRRALAAHAAGLPRACRAPAAAACSPWRRPSWPTPSSRTSADRPSPSTASSPCSRPPSAPPSAAGSPTTTRWRWIFFINIPVGILAFILVTRLVEDPPWIKPDRSRICATWTTWASRFLTIAMGGMQIMLDKGEENDWFASGFIRFFAVLFVGGMIGLVVWEWHTKSPLINLRLFRFKNFAICCFLMMLVGGVLNANTVLQPQFMQQLLGYNATTAGLALTAGGIALVIVMPLAGFATGKISARTLAVLRIHHVHVHVPLRRRRSPACR